MIHHQEPIGARTPVQIRGQLFESIAAAARELRISRTSIHRALERGIIDKCAQRWRGDTPCTINGKDYPSYQAASEDTGISLKAIRERCYRAMKNHATAPLASQAITMRKNAQRASGGAVSRGNGRLEGGL